MKLKPITFNDTVNSFVNHSSIGKIKGHQKDDFHWNLNNLQLINY